MMKETFKTMYQMMLYRLGFVLRSEYDRLVSEHQDLKLKYYKRPKFKY